MFHNYFVITVTEVAFTDQHRLLGILIYFQLHAQIRKCYNFCEVYTIRSERKVLLTEIVHIKSFVCVRPYNNVRYPSAKQHELQSSHYNH